MESFTAKIHIIGVNPYVFLPKRVLKSIFKQAGKDKGAIQVKGKLNGHKFIQNLVKYSGEWRLYLNTPMRKAAGIDTGDMADVEIEFDPTPRIIPVHPKFTAALSRSKKARSAFEKLSPSRQKEIVRYLGFLKTEESLDRNIARAIRHLEGKDRFVGRD